MKPHDPPDADLAGRYRAGDEWAAAALYRRYVARVLAVARSRQARSFVARYDPDDVAQAVFHDLFLRLKSESIEPADELWGFLLVLTLNKARSFVEHHSAAKRSVRRTQPSGDDRPEVADPRSTDSFAAAAILDELEALPTGDRRVVRLRLDGHEVDEIARATGRSRRTIERVLKSARARVAAVPESKS